MRPLFVVAILAVPILFAGCTEETPPPSKGEGCPTVSIHTLDMESHSNPAALWETNYGCFIAELFLQKAPITAGNFQNLTQKKFYDGTRFHRVIEGFMIQDGDPNSKDTAKQSTWGQGGPGYTIKDEFPCVDGNVSYTNPAQCSSHGGLVYRHSKAGVLSMANSGPSSGGSQYFITLTPTAGGGYPTHLDGKHAIFGQIVWNQNTVETIGRVPESGSPSNRPIDEVLIRSVTILTS